MRASEVRDLTDSLMFMVDMVEPEAGRDPELRDGKDQLVLGTFRAARAQYLITGDKDLLALAPRYPIVAPADFWRRHG
jgi:predicted nucleic acid-binding protein